ncbi:MAG: hypothetical protein KGI78_00270 [Patescibacteria group bacterium]|nr:hypothetical protein [Patescibacteria group bacterium]MDE1944068.1 hypothetical protein [Patescibacteria group bacterium]MDE1944729.1 hypothetical protein [Patescibacteria group bacterium]MDE2057273.1 hypothetical protein [Patescibacteria group bacterium]
MPERRSRFLYEPRLDTADRMARASREPMPPDPGPAPRRMTWAIALPIIAIAGVFWVLQALFEWFGFTGPALIGTAAGTWLAGYLGSFIGSLFGAGVAAASAFFGGEALEVLGMGIAEPIGLLGWLVVGLILLKVDLRLFKEDIRATLWFGAALIVAEIPLIGTIPSIVAATAILLRAQIKRERAAYAAWQLRVTEAQEAARVALEDEIAERRIAIEQQGYSEQMREQAANDNETLVAANDNAIPQELSVAA